MGGVINKAIFKNAKEKLPISDTPTNFFDFKMKNIEG